MKLLAKSWSWSYMMRTQIRTTLWEGVKDYQKCLVNAIRVNVSEIIFAACESLTCEIPF